MINIKIKNLNLDFYFIFYHFVFILGSPLIVTRTLKYFMGILNKAWIVNTQWIHQCLVSNEILEEVRYSVDLL